MTVERKKEEWERPEKKGREQRIGFVTVPEKLLLIFSRNISVYIFLSACSKFYVWIRHTSLTNSHNVTWEQNQTFVGTRHNPEIYPATFLLETNMPNKRIGNQFILVHLDSSTSYFFAAVLLVAVVWGRLWTQNMWEGRERGGPVLYLRLDEQTGDSTITHKPTLLMHRSLAIQI